MSDSVRPQRQQPTRLPRPWDSPGKNTGVACHFLLQCMKVKSETEVAQSCSTLRDLMDCRLPGSSVHGIFQARVLEWGAIAPFKGKVFSRNPGRMSTHSSFRNIGLSFFEWWPCIILVLNIRLQALILSDLSSIYLICILPPKWKQHWNQNVLHLQTPENT